MNALTEIQRGTLTLENALIIPSTSWCKCLERYFTL